MKPFLKWVGGKTNILDKLTEYIPREINNYYEPFLGGGSVLIHFLGLVEKGCILLKGNVYASDINETLINTYKSIQARPEILSKTLKVYFDEYNETKNKEEYYYKIRTLFNSFKEHSIEKSAVFIFLNKTCFRGLYRENKNGKFNVPYGHYKTTPKMITLEELKKLQKLFEKVTFEIVSFENVLDKVQEGDFVYLDPPYVPVNETKTDFVQYNSKGFDKQFHSLLFEKVKQLKGNFTMSNSNCEMTIQTFSNSNVNVIKVIAKRSIHSKNPETKTTELIISNC